MAELLQVEDLTVEFGRGPRRPPLRAVNDVSLSVGEGEAVGLIGESGSGKSTIGRAILGLQKPTSGTIRWEDNDLSGFSPRRRRTAALDLQAIFQDPYSSLNPSMTIEQTLVEPLRLHHKLSRAEARDRAVAALEAVGLPKQMLARLPHQFSGGQRQRIAIARAITLGPRLIVCDEPVSALDVSTQAQVLNMLRRLRAERGLAYLFVAHDVAVVRNMCERIFVLYRGTVVESGPADQITNNPQHPYTRALLSAIPVDHPRHREAAWAQRRLAADAASASVADANASPGCVFAPRCPFAADVCRASAPRLLARGSASVACHLYDPGSAHPGALGNHRGAPLPQAPHDKTEYHAM
jgi:oligopeptide/dipeptide ABC transporter ATP-binding protein